MENTQRIWILCVIVLSLNCLTAEEGATAAKRHLIINAARLIQYIYFENALTSKLKSKDMLLWRRGFAFVYTKNERLRIHSRLRKIRYDQGRPTEKSPMETDRTDDPRFQSTCVAVSYEFYIENSFKTAGLDDPPSQNIPFRT